jgi:alkaline phosphatase D
LEDGPEATMLGTRQEAWLGRGLRNQAHWNLIAQQVFVMPMQRLLPDGTLQPGGKDTWNGYPAARRRLVKSILDADLRNVVIASGDAHIHAIGSVPVRDDEPDGPAAAAEFLVTSISSGGDGAAETAGTRAMLAGSPNIRLVNAQRGYQTFDITAAEWTADVKVVDKVLRPGGTIATVARFSVSPERPGLTPN